MVTKEGKGGEKKAKRVKYRVTEGELTPDCENTMQHIDDVLKKTVHVKPM